LDIPENRVGAKLVMYRRNDTAEVYPAFRIIKIERTLSKKMVPEDLPKKTEETSMNLEMKSNQKLTT
jgi:hypothetical protein